METHRLALPAGYRIENYEIQAVLGKGGFGITYVAYDWTLGRHMAVKELLPDSIATRIEGSTVVAMGPSHEESWQWARERFVEEARILAGFRHQNIIAVHRLIEANGTVYLVMDHLEGESYEARLRRIGREPDETSLMAVISPLLDGLQEVHAAGLLHRDIKPENILFDKRGNPVLIDFGAARATVGATMTMTSIVTHGYSPIEQYQTKGKMGPWTDIYAAGAVMYRAITGEKPPVAADRVGTDCYVPLLSYPSLSGFSQPLLHAVDSSLAIFGEQRPQSISEWVIRFSNSQQEPARASAATIKTCDENHPDASSALCNQPANERRYSVICPHCNWSMILETDIQTSFECACCGAKFDAKPRFQNAKEWSESACGANCSDEPKPHKLPLSMANWAKLATASLILVGLIYFGFSWALAVGNVQKRMDDSIRQQIAAKQKEAHEFEMTMKAMQFASSVPPPTAVDQKKKWVETQVSRLEALKASEMEDRQREQRYKEALLQEKAAAIAKQNEEARIRQLEADQQAQKAAERVARDMAAKKKEREQSMLLAEQKLQEAQAAWSEILTKANVQSPFVSPAGLRFARVPGTDFMVSLNLVSRSAFASFQGTKSSNNEQPAYVTYREATDFCLWLSMSEKKNYHLPTEEEWIKVAQSGIISDGGSLWIWCSDEMKASAYSAGGDGKILLGETVKPAYRDRRSQDIGFRCILSPSF